MLAQHAENKKIKSNILQIAEDARLAKLANPNTIDGTIGTLFDEEGKLIKFKTVTKVLDGLSDHEKYAYSPTAGDEAFKEGIIHWALLDNYDDITSVLKYRVVATPGGSGAIGSVMGNYLNPGDEVITSDLGWGPYAIMAKDNFLSIRYYHLFDENYKFNMADYKKTVEEVAKKQGRVMVIINDPCHNPTGFALSLDDWKEIIEHANELSKNYPFILFLDMAYIDYLPAGLDKSREVFKLFKNITDNVLVCLGFSGSKTFSVYGMRVGAQVGLSKSSKVVDEFYNANEFSARAKWSNINHAGLGLVGHLMGNEDNKKAFEGELKEASKMLTERSILFLKEAKDVDLFTYPYEGGFFITIPCNGEEVFEKLRNKDIFVVPLKEGIRISLSALSKKNIEGLAGKIKAAI